MGTETHEMDVTGIWPGKRQIETTDVDVEAVAWAIEVIEAMHVQFMSKSNANMLQRLRVMVGA